MAFDPLYVERNFDDYLPVFVYSHASYASQNENCKVANPDPREGGVQESSLKEFNDFFTKVPKDAILIDPVVSGIYCSSGYAIDDLFPWAISDFGNDTFLSSNRYPYKHMIDDIDKEDNDRLATFYRNAKLYYENEYINNFRITFDSGDDVPWNIRVPVYDSEGEITTNKKGEIVYDYPLKGWTRHYSQKKVSGQCIYLNELLKKINELRNIPGNSLHQKGGKIAIYLVSCRGHFSYEDMDIALAKQLFAQHPVIEENGRMNIERIRPGTTSARVTRGMVGEEGTYQMDRQVSDTSDDEDEDIDMLARNSDKGIQARYNVLKSKKIVGRGGVKRKHKKRNQKTNKKRKRTVKKRNKSNRRKRTIRSTNKKKHKRKCT